MEQCNGTNVYRDGNKTSFRRCENEGKTVVAGKAYCDYHVAVIEKNIKEQNAAMKRWQVEERKKADLRARTAILLEMAEGIPTDALGDHSITPNSENPFLTDG